MNIAIFGGSFDPPHIGHEAIVKNALKHLDVDRLFVVPTYLNPFKSTSFFSSKTRLKLMKKLFKSLDKVRVCDFEVKSNQPTPSFLTVKYLKKRYKPKKIYLIIGADNYKTLGNWSNINYLKKNVKFVVITRKDHKIKKGEIKISKVIELDFNISSTKLRDNMNLKYVPKKINKKVKKLWKIESKEL